MDDLRNISIDGIGTLTEGNYNRVDLSGVSKVIGNVKANNLVVSGLCNSSADITADFVNISGVMKSENGLTSKEKVDISGTSKIKFINANILNISGTSKVNGDCSFDRADISGSIKVNGSCEGRDIKVDGIMDVTSLLSADRIEISIQGRCNINEIGGEEITIKKGFGFSIPLLPILKKKVICNVIEGDKIYLENTKCNIVRGRDITIGPNCTIEKVEYTNSFYVEDKNAVKEIKKL